MSGFTIPNTPDSFNQNQAEPDSLDFQILGNQRSGVISGCAVSTNATAQKVTVAAGEVLINGAYYPYAGGVVDLTAYSSPAFFDIIHARVSGSTVTCYAVAPATGSTNPRFPASGSGANQVNLDSTDVVLASVYRVDNGVVDAGAIIDKRVFVRSTTNRTLGDTVSANRGSAGDTYVNTGWTPGSTTASPFSVKVGSTWYNLAYWAANSNITTSGTITAGSFVGPLSGNATTATSATSATSATTVPWSGVSGKPSLVENNGGTYSINISGFANSASSAGYATSAGHATTAGDASSLQGRTISITGEVDKIVSLDANGYATAYSYTSANGVAYWYARNYGYTTLFRVSTSQGVYGNSLSGRDVYVASDGTLGYLSSSLKYKHNIETADIDINAVLNIEPVLYSRKEEYSIGTTTNAQHLGVIAEQVESLGLTHLVDYEEDGTVDGFKYNLLAVALLSVVKNLNERLEALEGK